MTMSYSIELQRLHEECPAATNNERLRFLNAKGGDLEKATNQLTKYLVWRNEHNLDDACTQTVGDDLTMETSLNEESSWYSCASDDDLLDQVDWRFASRKALRYCEQQTSQHTSTRLPQLTRLLPTCYKVPRDQKGHRILHFLPAMMDLSKASEDVFALSIALYLERKLDRNSNETITVAIDCRGGTGWANPKPQTLIPFLQQVAAVLEQNFPERLAKCLLYPVPTAAFFLYTVVKRFLDPKTVEKVGLIPGDSRNCAPVPLERMQEYIDATSLAQMEDFRMRNFVDDSDTL